MSITNLKNKIKKNSFVYNLGYDMLVLLPRRVRFFRKSIEIKNKDSFINIKKYKDIHKGEKCYIVGTAPSLNIDDVEMLKGKYSIGVNSLVTIFDRTDWRPTYYGIQDSGVERVKEQLLNYRKDFKEFFVGVSIIENLVPHIGCEEVNYLLNILDHDRPGTKHIIKCSCEADKFLYDGFSITFSMIELAMYMGFSEIVLLGIDCDYSGKKIHFEEYTDARVPDASINMYQAYCELRKFAERNGIKIKNASRGWKLKAFECVTLEDEVAK